MDLDDEELKATRILNGVNKEEKCPDCHHNKECTIEKYGICYGAIENEGE